MQIGHVPHPAQTCRLHVRLHGQYFVQQLEGENVGNDRNNSHRCSVWGPPKSLTLSWVGAGAARLGSRSNAIETTISAPVVIPVALSWPTRTSARCPLAEPLGLLSQRLELGQLPVELGAVGGPAPVELRARDAM